MDKDDLIKAHQKIRLTEISVLRRLNLSFNDCLDDIRIRNFCASNKRTLPDMIEIEVVPFSEDVDGKRAEEYQWHVIVYEQPNLREGA